MAEVEELLREEGDWSLNDSSNNCIGSDHLKAPDFISEKKTFKTYVGDLRIWSRMTKIKPEHQAEFIVYNLDRHPTGIKDIIQMQMVTKIENSTMGIKDLINFLLTIYVEYQDITRQSGKSMVDLLNR